MKRILILCLFLVMLASCTQRIHYDTFDELLASIEVENFPSDERSTHGLIYNFASYKVAGEYQHITEYDGLSKNISEFAVIEVYSDDYGTWYHPNGHTNHEYLILISNDNSATIWRRDESIITLFG